MSDPAASLSGHGKRVDVLQWHPSAGQVVASGSTDGTVRLWDISKQESKLSVAIGPISFCAFVFAVIGLWVTGVLMYIRRRCTAGIELGLRGCGNSLS